MFFTGYAGPLSCSTFFCSLLKLVKGNVITYLVDMFRLDNWLEELSGLLAAGLGMSLLKHYEPISTKSFVKR